MKELLSSIRDMIEQQGWGEDWRVHLALLDRLIAGERPLDSPERSLQEIADEENAEREEEEEEEEDEPENEPGNAHLLSLEGDE